MCAQIREPVLEAACGYTHSGACDDGEAEGATLFWWQRNLVVALWIALALPHALPWPLCTCFWSPAHDFGLYPHVFCEICTLVCVALCDSRVVRIALLLRCRLDVCAKSAGCHVCRTLVSGVVSSLKVIVGVLETL